MPYVILPSGETRYYNGAGDEVVGYSGSDAMAAGGDTSQDYRQGADSAPISWSGSGALPWGVMPSGRAIRVGGGTTGNDTGVGAANPATSDSGSKQFGQGGSVVKLPRGAQADVTY